VVFNAKGHKVGSAYVIILRNGQCIELDERGCKDNTACKALENDSHFSVTAKLRADRRSCDQIIRRILLAK